MGGGGKGGGSGNTTTTVRFADYIEDAHRSLLGAYRYVRDERVNLEPYGAVAAIPVDTAFLGVGFLLADFPALYELYGRFMSGLDVEELYATTFADMMQGPQITELIAAESALMDDDLIMNTLPRFQVGMRDINSVVSSSFVIGKSLIEDARTKALAKFSGELRYRLIPVITEHWARRLEWNKTVVMGYAEIVKLYLTSKMDIDNHNVELVVKNLLWKFTVLDYERLAVAAMTGATKSSTNVAGSSGLGRAIGGVASGALGGFAMGALAGESVGGPLGAIIGGAAGLAGMF